MPSTSHFCLNNPQLILRHKEYKSTSMNLNSTSTCPSANHKSANLSFRILTTLVMLFSLAVGQGWGDTVTDIVPISSDFVFIADNITSNGTVKLTANTLYEDGHIFANTGNTVATNKKTSTFAGGDHLNSLRLKNTQDQLVFKVSGKCKITFYTDSDASRGINVGTTAGGTDLGVQPVSTTVWTIDINQASTVYLSSYNDDFYFAGFVVDFPEKAYMPEIVDNGNGKFTVTGLNDDKSQIYYTTDGTDPVKGTNNIASGANITLADGQTLKVRDFTGEDGFNLPSDISHAFRNITGNFTWLWETKSVKADLNPVVYGLPSEAFVSYAVSWGSKLTNKDGLGPYQNQNWGGVWSPTEDMTDATLPSEDAAVKFVFTPNATISFIPTNFAFHALKQGTGNGGISVKAVCDSKEVQLLEKTDLMKNDGNSGTRKDFLLNFPEGFYVQGKPLVVTIYWDNKIAKDKNYMLSDVSLSGKVDGAVKNVKLYNLSTKVNPSAAGSISKTPNSETVPENTEVTVTANVAPHYEFSHWTYNGEEVSREKTYKFTITEDASLVAEFVPQKSVTYSKGNDAAIQGMLPPTEYYNNGTKITFPANKYLYKKGYTLTGWNDGALTHAPGSTMILKQDITLTPVFTANAASARLDNLSTETTITWTLGESAYTINVPKEQVMPLVQQIVVDGKSVDIPLFLDAKESGFSTNNVWVKCGAGDYVTFPVVKGSKVKYQLYEIEDRTKSTINGDPIKTNGERGKLDASNYSYTDEESKKIDMIFGQGQFMQYVTVTYPVAVVKPVINYTGEAESEVTITCSTVGAKIYYTTDGTEPTSASTLYDSAHKPVITLNSGVTIKAIAILDGHPSSVVVSRPITTKAVVPVIECGDYLPNESLYKVKFTINESGANATLFYSIDGGAPQQYNGETVKAPVGAVITAYSSSDAAGMSDEASLIIPAAPAWGAHEKMVPVGKEDSTTKNITHNTISTKLEGQYISGRKNASSFKLTTNGYITTRDVSNNNQKGVKFDVKEGFVITNFTLGALVGNTKNTTADGTVTKVYIDGTELANFTPVTVHPINGDATSIALKDISAKSSIEFVFDGQGTNQHIASVDIDYEFEDELNAVVIEDIPLSASEFEALRETRTHSLTEHLESLPTVIAVTKKHSHNIEPEAVFEEESGKYVYTISVNSEKYHIEAADVALVAPNIVVDELSLAAKGYPFVLKGAGFMEVNIDDAGWIPYNKAGMTVVHNVKARAYVLKDEVPEYTDVSEWTATTNYEPGRPFVVWITTGNGSQANPIGRKLAQDYNLIDYRDNISWTDLVDADLVVMTEEISGGSALSLAIRDNLLGKVNIINMKAFHYGSSTKDTDRWAWGLPVEETIGNTSLSVRVDNPLSLLYEGVSLKERGDGTYWVDLWTKDADPGKKHLQYLSYTNNVNPVKFFRPLAYVPGGQVFMHGADHAKFTDAGVADENSKGYLLISMHQEDNTHYSEDVARLMSNAVAIMCDPTKSLFAEVTTLPAPTVVDAEDGSAKVETATTLAKIYYTTTQAATPAPTKAEIKAGGKYTLTGKTEKWNNDVYVWAYAELTKTDHSVIESDVTPVGTLIKGNHNRIVTLVSDPKDLAEGSTVHAIYDATQTHTVPYNTSFYKAGKTVKKWKGSDGKEYTPGADNFMDGNIQDITLTAVFEDNDVKLTDATEPTTVTWDFRTSHNAPAIAVENGSSGGTTSFLMGHAIIGGKLLDVRLDINAATSHVNDAANGGNDETVGGKFNNTYSGEYAQVRHSTEFSFPAVYGMEVKLTGVDFPIIADNVQYFKTTEVGKSTLTDGTFKGQIENESPDHSNSGIFSFNGETAKATLTELDPGAICYQEFTYAAGTDKAHDYKVNDVNYGGGFYQSISVTYPALYTVETSVTPAESEFAYPDAEGKTEAAGEIEQSAAHQNTDGKFLPGDEVTVKTKPNYGYSFTNVTKGGVTLEATDGTDADAGKKITKYNIQQSDAKTISIVANYTAQTAYTLTTVAKYAEGGETSTKTTITASPDYKKYVEGSKITLTGNFEITYGPKEWQMNDIKIDGSDRKESVTITMPAQDTSVDLIIQLMVKGDVNFDKGTTDFTILPQGITDAFSVTPPVYHTLYKEGKTLTGWTGNGVYGNEHTVADADRTFPIGVETGLREGPNGEKLTYTLTPNYTDNSQPQRIDGRSEAVEITWKFTTGEKAQGMDIGSNKNVFYVAPASVKRGTTMTEPFDVPMSISTGRRGKVNNLSTPDWCSLGTGTVLRVPACEGATVEMEVRKQIVTTTFGGQVPTDFKVKYEGEDEARALDPNETKAIKSYIYKKVYDGWDDYLDIVIGTDYSFYRYVKVTIPAEIKKHEVAIVNTDWTNWDDAVGQDGQSGGHAGASALSGTDKESTGFKTHFTNEDITLQTYGIAINKTRYTGVYIAKYELDGYITINTKQGADAPYMKMGQFKNVTRIKFRQGSSQQNGSGWKVTVKGKPESEDGEEGETQEEERVIRQDGKSTAPEWVDLDVYMNDCTITFENITSTDQSAYEAAMFDLIVYGTDNTTSSLMNIRTSVNDELAGVVKASPDYRDYPRNNDRNVLQYEDGSKVTLATEANDGWEFVKWQEENADGTFTDLSTNATYTIDNLQTDRNIQAVFKRMPVFTFIFGGHNYAGSVPESQQVKADGTFAIPYNRTLYKDDNSTLIGWEMTQYDGSTKHQFNNASMKNAPQTFKTGDSWYHENLYDINLSPIMKDNTVSLLDIDQKFTEGVKARWYFGATDGAPELNIENKVGFLMTQAQVTDDEFIDLRMYIDALSSTGRGKGKVNNVGRWDNKAQVNAATLFTIPATKGMKLEIAASNQINGTLFGDANASGAVDDNASTRPTTTGTTATWTYLGNNNVATIDVYDGSYYQYIEATYYPRLPKPTIRMKEMGNEIITLTIAATTDDPSAKTYYSIDGSEPTTPVPADGIITFANPSASITIKAITISDNRPDSEVESYMVAPYNTNKRTVMYLYNGKQPGYSINNDIMYRTLMFGAANNYAPLSESGCNVLAHDVSTPSYDIDETPAGTTRTYYANSNYIFVAPDGLIAAEAPLPGIADSEKAKIRRYIADLIANDHIVVTPMTVVGKLLNKDPEPSDLAGGLVTVPSGKDNLRMLDYVLMDAHNQICVSWTGQIAVNDLTLNAAYMLANSVKTIVDHYSGIKKDQSDIVASATAMSPTEELNLLGTQTTDNPQLRNQKVMAAGRDQVDAKPIELADLADGELHIVLPKLPGSPSVISAEAWVNGTICTDENKGKVTVEKDPNNQLNSTITLTGNGQTRIYKIFATLDAVTNELIFTEDGNNVDDKYWTNGVWRVGQLNGFVSGNTGDVFKFNVNNDDVITVSGPANYAIKSISFQGYHYVSSAKNQEPVWAAGDESKLTYKFVNQPYDSMNPNVSSSLKMYNTQAGDEATKDELKAEFGLYSTNSVSFKLNETSDSKLNGQAIGRFVVEYYLRESTTVTLNTTNTADHAEKEHNGVISLDFSSLMSDVNSDAGVTLTSDYGESTPLTAPGNSQVLRFTFWDKAPGNYTLTIPFSALKDVDGNVFKGDEATTAEGKMTKSGNSYVVPITIKAPIYERKTFDFIVDGVDHSTRWDGSFIEGINQIGDNKGIRKRMLFLNRKDEYFIEPGTPDNHNNGTSTKFTDANGPEEGGTGKGNETSKAYNSHTRLTAQNISLIGESQEGVVIANKPALESMSTTPTIEFKTKDCTDNYLQDITIRNKYPYLQGATGRATAFYDSGFNTIMKNVRLESYQDTYYTHGHHTYGEDCTFMGVVDFIYGGGDHWYERCNILLRNRYGNNIVAPSTSPSEKWGYVFNNCTIDKEEGATMVTDRNWTLARPWQGSPASTFINTTMNVLPNNVGYAYMSAIPLIVRFHEYGSKDKNGTTLDLASRSIAICAPAAGSDSPVMTAEQAAKYDIRTVIGGDDGYDPREHTRQIDKINSLYVDGQTLYWKDDQKALCYLVYYLGDGAEPNDDPVLVANIAPEYQNGEEASFNLFESHVFRGEQSFDQWYNGLSASGRIMKTNESFTHGWFAVRAANQRGGLNEMSEAVEYHKAHIYRARVTTGGKQEGDDSGNVWSTIYLDFNAKVPNNVIAYALTDITAFGGVDVTETTVHLTRVSNNASTAEKQDIVYANMGYVLYGPGPEHSSRTSEYRFIETGHMNVVEGTEEESRTDFRKSYLSGTVGKFGGKVSNDMEGETGDDGWSESSSDYTDVPVGYITAYTLATKTVENTSFGLGFYKYKGSTFGHHKAYLDTDDVRDLLSANGVDGNSIDDMLSKGFTVMLHDSNDVVTKVIQVENSQVTDTSDAIYNIAGQKIRPELMRKNNIYIINGKKTVIK